MEAAGCCIVHIVSNRGLRGKWQAEAELEAYKPRAGHAHGLSASARTAASRTIDNFAHLAGLDVYTVSMSSREGEHATGSHGHYMAKDVAHAARHDPVQGNQLIKQVDVDYYVDQQRWLSHCRPVCAFTMAPTSVVYHGAEYSYALTPTGIEMQVSGGGTYAHQLWDYSADTIVTRVRSWKPWRWFESVVSSVDCRQVDEHHMLVLLVPFARIRFGGWWIEGERLRRQAFGDSKVVQNRFVRGGVDTISLGLTGTAASVDLAPAQYEAVRIRYQSSKKPMISDVERYLREFKTVDHVIGGPVLYEILQHSAKPIKHVNYPANGVFQTRRYQAVQLARDGGVVSEDGREIGRAIAPSLVTHPDVVPNRSYNNDLASITGRVRAVHNGKVPEGLYTAYAREFVHFVVPLAGRGRPLPFETVVALQDRPAQRARSDQKLAWLSTSPCVQASCMIKGESYPVPSDPRNITTVGVQHTVQLSCYTYAFKIDCLQAVKAYAPCLSPGEVAQRLVGLCASYDTVTETDFSRYDGTISRWLRTFVEGACYLRWVGPECRKELEELLNAELGCRARTSEGIPYDPKGSRLSGSPLTTDGNTLINMFVSYAAARSAGSRPEQAWALLGLYAGDDGVTPLHATALDRAASDLGLRLKSVQRSKGIVTFLGRVFGNLWNGDPGSVQDPMRTWRKLHLSFASADYSVAECAVARAKGYESLDPGVPVVAEWARVIHAVYGTQTVHDEVTRADTPYYARVWGGWPQMTRSNALDTIAERTGKSAGEIEAWCDVLREAARRKDITMVEGLIENEDTPPSLTAAVCGEIITAPQSPTAPLESPSSGVGSSASSQAGSAKPRRSRTRSARSNTSRPSASKHPGALVRRPDKGWKTIFDH